MSGLEGGNAVAYTVDGQWENTDGLSLYAAFLGYYTDAFGDGDSTNDIGALAQIAQVVGRKTEIFGRAGWIDFDAGDSTLELTVGRNYYIQGHAAKFTLDASWLPSGSPSNVTGLGILVGDDSQFLLRGQFQLLL
jgi:hypothetical protein